VTTAKFGPVLCCRVRHEAAEALGAIAAPDCLEVLQKHTTDSCQEVAETCQLALGRLEYLQQKQAAAADGSSGDKGGTAAAGAPAAAEAEEESPYYSVDPTPALPSSTPVEQLRSILLDPQQPMFEVRLCCWSHSL
jgi:deoxyhypusine monooxygenase